MKRGSLGFVAVFLIANRALADDAVPSHTYVAPTALMQLDFQNSPQEEANTGFSLQRFRLGAWSQPVDYLFALAQVQIDPADETPAVLDAYVRVGPWHGLRFTAGYFRSPLFISARNELDGMAPFPELSLPAKALWPGRDLAIEAHYAPDHFPLEAWLRLGNGNPSPNENDLQNAFALTGRVDATLGRGRIDATGLETFGLRVGAAAVVDFDSYDRSGIGGVTAGGYPFYRPPVVSGTRSIIEGHALFYAGPLRFLIEAGAALESRDTSKYADPALSRGVAGEVSWMITGQHRLPSVWPVHATKSPFAFDHPAIEIAARGERLDAGGGTRDYASGGASGASFAANAYLNAMLGLTLAGYYYRYDAGPIEEPTRRDSWLLQARLTIYLNPPPLGSRAAPPLLGLH